MTPSPVVGVLCVRSAAWGRRLRPHRRWGGHRDEDDPGEHDPPTVDGRNWTARAAIAVLPVLATGIVGTEQLVLVAGITCGWIPVISLTQWVQEWHRGTVQQLLALVVDLAVLWSLAEVEPALTPVVLVLLASAGFLHAAGLSATGRAIALGLVVLSQLVIGAPDTAVAIGVATLDVTAVVVGIAVLGEQDRHRQRTSAALDRADQLTDAVLAGIGEAVVVTDPAGVITSTNDAAELTFGHAVAGRCSDALGLRRGAGMLDCSRGCPLLDEEAGTGRADVSREHPNGTRQALLVNVRHYVATGLHEPDLHLLVIDVLAVPAAVYFLGVTWAIAEGHVRDWAEDASDVSQPAGVEDIEVEELLAR